MPSERAPSSSSRRSPPSRPHPPKRRDQHMPLLLAVVVGFLAGRLLLALLGPMLENPFLQRENYRGLVVPTSAGIVVPLAVILVEAGRAVAGAAGAGRPA